MTYRVYVTRVIPQPGIDLLRRHADVDVNEDDTPLSHDYLCQAAGEYDALVTLLTDKIDRGVFEAGRGKLKIVANVAVGFDNIDIDAATDNRIMVTNTPGVLTETTADFAWALLMATARRVVESDAFLRAGNYHGWGIMMLLGADVFGKTLGLVGFGRVGHAMARRAHGFDMRVVYYDPLVPESELTQSLRAERLDLDTLLKISDFVSVHTPLSPETHHLIGAEQFGEMKQTAFLINTSRGPVLDEAALAGALQNGEIAGAALDVYEREPEVFPDLMELSNVILTPHVASASTATRTRMATMAAENVIAALAGETPPTLLNPAAIPG